MLSGEVLPHLDNRIARVSHADMCPLVRVKQKLPQGLPWFPVILFKKTTWYTRRLRAPTKANTAHFDCDCPFSSVSLLSIYFIFVYN